MFNWVSGPWLVCIVAALIAMAFFWPHNKNTQDSNVNKLNNTQAEIVALSYEGRDNSFSRDDDRARLLQFKELDAFDRNIETLLEEAKNLVSSLSYTLPEERNAIMVYQEILALSPNNTDAQNGIEDITNKLLGIGERALNSNKLSSANRTLQKLVNINQKSEQTIQLTSAISRWHEKKKISDLVIAGNQAFEQGNYIAPATKNALYYYEQTLSQDRNNLQAKQGIQEIINIYHQRTQSAIDDKQASQASTNLEILRAVSPQDDQILEYQNEILKISNEQQ